jgi:hypothetical protein
MDERYFYVDGHCCHRSHIRPAHGYKRPVSGDLIAILAFLLFRIFMLPTRIITIHVSSLRALALIFPKLKHSSIILTATFLINQAYVLYWLNISYPNAGPNLTGDTVVLATSVINLIMLLYALLLTWNELKGRGWLKTETTLLNQTQDTSEPPK